MTTKPLSAVHQHLQDLKLKTVAAILDAELDRAARKNIPTIGEIYQYSPTVVEKLITVGVWPPVPLSTPSS